MPTAVLALTNSLDESAGAVIGHLDAMCVQAYRFDTDKLHDQVQISMRQEGDQCCGVISDTQTGCRLTTREVGSVWHRRPQPNFRRQQYSKGVSNFIGKETGVALLALYSVLDHAKWMNPLGATRLLDNNKLLQCRLANTLGLQTPRTCITSDPAELESFCKDVGGTLVVKLLFSGSYFLDEKSEVPLQVFTTPLTQADVRAYADGIRLCPVLAQEYVPKRLELRVFVVGREVFAAAIHSQSSQHTRDDWRNYDFKNVPHEPWSLPDQVTDRLLRFCAMHKMLYGAFDLVLTPSGEYVFLEVNTSGQWLWIEEITGLQVSKAIATALVP